MKPMLLTLTVLLVVLAVPAKANREHEKEVSRLVLAVERSLEFEKWPGIDVQETYGEGTEAIYGRFATKWVDIPGKSYNTFCTKVEYLAGRAMSDRQDGKDFSSASNMFYGYIVVGEIYPSDGNRDDFRDRSTLRRIHNTLVRAAHLAPVYEDIRSRRFVIGAFVYAQRRLCDEFTYLYTESEQFRLNERLKLGSE